MIIKVKARGGVQPTDPIHGTLISYAFLMGPAPRKLSIFDFEFMSDKVGVTLSNELAEREFEITGEAQQLTFIGKLLTLEPTESDRFNGIVEVVGRIQAQG